MSLTPLPSAESRLPWLFLASAVALWISYGLGAWEGPDRQVFLTYNGWLANSEPNWRFFWAFVNTRVFDALAGVGMGTAFLVPGLFFNKRELPVAACRFAVVLAVTEVGRLVLPMLTSPRPSPSLEYLPQLNSLLDYYPEWQPRVFSKTSFPSDHAAILFAWAAFLLLSSRSRTRWLPLIYACLLAMPRLVGGGHWLSDIAVGGVSLACLGLGLGYVGSWAERAQRLGQDLATRLWGPPTIGPGKIANGPGADSPDNLPEPDPESLPPK